MSASTKTVRWPRILTPTQLAQLIRQQKNPDSALHLFSAAPLLYPSTYRHNSLVLSTLFDSLSNSPSHLPVLLSLLPSPSSSSSRDDSLFSRAIVSLSPRPDLALSLFRRLPLSPSPRWSLSFHSILRVLISNDDFETAHQLFVEMSQRPEVCIGLPSLNLIIETLCRIGRVDLALEVFMEIKEQCCYPDRHTYRSLMRGLCESGRLDDGIHLLYSMLWRISQKGCEADVVVYRMLLEKLCEGGKVREAEMVLGKVLLKGLRSPRRRRAFVKPELVGLELEEMKRRIDELLVVGGVRSLKSYAAVIDGLYEEMKLESAGKMFDEMIDKGFRPDVSMYEKKIAALCNMGRVGDGKRVLEVEMKEGGCAPSVKAYNLVMEGLCNEGNSRKAVEYLGKMEKQVGCIPAEESFEILVNGLLRERKFVEAAEVLERMARRKYWPKGEIFSEVIRGLCYVGRGYEAVLWLEEMVSQAKVPGVSVWSSLVSTVCVDSKDELVSSWCWLESLKPQDSYLSQNPGFLPSSPLEHEDNNCNIGQRA